MSVRKKGRIYGQTPTVLQLVHTKTFSHGQTLKRMGFVRGKGGFYGQSVEEVVWGLLLIDVRDQIAEELAGGGEGDAATAGIVGKLRFGKAWNVRVML